jgi:hypothetical protein
MAKRQETMPSNKTELRELVAQMTADYLANGGTITQCKTGRRALVTEKVEEN